jgi:hypothetical protein
MTNAISILKRDILENDLQLFNSVRWQFYKADYLFAIIGVEGNLQDANEKDSSCPEFKKQQLK